MAISCEWTGLLWLRLSSFSYIDGGSCVLRTISESSIARFGRVLMVYIFTGDRQILLYRFVRNKLSSAKLLLLLFLSALP